MLDNPAFDAPGMATARRELWKLGGISSGSTYCMRKRLFSVVRELYPEIRTTREQGHGWKKVADIIRLHTETPCTPLSVQKCFEEIDAEWAAETDVPALAPEPEEEAPPRRRGRPPKKKPQGALEKLEARIECKEEI
ncbi:MAG: hypothetical protein ACOYJV_01590 [Aminivibrio sp.]